MIKRRVSMTGDQWLLIVNMLTITGLVLAGLLVLAFAPAAKSDTVIPLISLGVTAIISLAGKPSFPASNEKPAPAGPDLPPSA